MLAGALPVCQCFVLHMRRLVGFVLRLALMNRVLTAGFFTVELPTHLIIVEYSHNTV